MPLPMVTCSFNPSKTGSPQFAAMKHHQNLVTHYQISHELCVTLNRVHIRSASGAHRIISLEKVVYGEAAEVGGKSSP